MDIYIKPAKRAEISERQKLYLEDIAEVFAPGEIIGRIKKIKLLEIKENVKKSYLVSVIDIIEAIDKTLPGNTISNVGEMETLVEYKPEKSRNSKLWRYFKMTVVSVMIFMGASTAIMSFHTDAQIPDVFKKYYKTFFGKESEKPLIIEIPYAIGLAAGIAIFFNHIGGKKITDDPTPIEVEIALYEQDVADTKLEVLSAQKSKKPEAKK